MTHHLEDSLPMTKTSFAPSDIRGIIPPLVTPFDADEEVDEAALRQQVRYMLGQGVHGFVPGGSTGEGFTFSREDLCRVVAVTAEEVNGRVPVIPGIIVNSTREAIARARSLAQFAPAALQITPAHYIFKTDDDSMVRHYREIHEAVGIPILIYNVVPWNYLSPQLLQRVMREVPGVIGVKQSAGDLKLLADLIADARPQERILSGIDSLLYPAFALGVHGVISQLLAAVPGPAVELWNLVQAGDHVAARGLHERMLRLWNAIYSDNRVAVTKYTLSLQGVPVGRPRRPLLAPTPGQQAAVRKHIGALLPAEQLARES
jgi:4-hydroxy-tetrahydrodipicolinate synthase